MVSTGFRFYLVCLLCVAWGSKVDAQTPRKPLPPDLLRQSQWAHDVARIAVAQMPETSSVQDMQSYVKQAQRDGAEVILFPEYILNQVHLSVGQSGAYTDPKVAAISSAAKDASIYVLIGSWVFWGNATTPIPNQYTNTIIIFGRNGQIEGLYNKTHAAVGGPPHFWPALPGDMEATMYLGQEYPVFDFDFARIGIQTCYDGYFPEPMRAMSLQGAEIIFWPNSRGGQIEQYLVQSSAFFNFVHVVAVNSANGFGSGIFDHHVGPVAGPCPLNHTSVCYVVGILDLRTLRIARKHSRMLHQRRADLSSRTVAFDWATAEFYDDYPDTTKTEDISMSIAL